MTVFLCHEYDAGYCLLDNNGYMVCAIWFDTEQAALDYCEKHNMIPIFYDKDSDDD